MGCSASKEVIHTASSVTPTGRSEREGGSASTSTTTSKNPASPTQASKNVGISNGLTKTNDGPSAPASSSFALGSRDDWKVRPGYSSGASSYAGSDAGSDMELRPEDEEVTATRERIATEGSMHTHILDLSSLRQEMVNGGDLARTVVRIETPFDTPIEEIYDGVLNGPVLGSGVSGIVRLVIHRATGIKYAVKCLDLGLIDTTEGLRQLRTEIFIMCQLDHPNIVRIEEVYESSNEIYIVQELCLGGDLFDRLDEQPDYHYTEVQCAKLVKQMLSSIRYLHSKGIIHRDLKLENFLFSNSDADSELKMIDFGLSKHFDFFGQSHCEKVGTPYTVAPEIIEGSYDEKSDMWALGVITYLLLSGETPFGGLDGESLLLVKANIMRGEVSFEPRDIWEMVSAEGLAFVKTLLNLDPKMRPTAKEMQRCTWIQVCAKLNAKEGNKLNPKTVGALMKFKESSDMQKLLSEVLSFTLLPEQIVDLRKEFEKMDDHGDGEISLGSLKRVLMQNAEVGALGALTEQEVEDIFDSIRVRKSEPTIRWHEFLAAGLSQARVDDRNLRLAFERLDNQRKGFITFDDLSDILGSSTEYEALEKIWLESLEECKAHLDRITFDDFKNLMKGQPKEAAVCPPLTEAMAMCPPSPGTPLYAVPEGEKVEMGLAVVHSGLNLAGMDDSSDLIDDSIENPREYYKKKRSSSCEQKLSSWESEAMDEITELGHDVSLAVILRTHGGDEFDIRNDAAMSPLTKNRAIYRKHREMRLAVLEASKQFDKKRTDIQSKTGLHTRASLIMKRGTYPPVPPMEVEDAHARALFEVAAKRCGRERHERKKTVSDVSGMLFKAAAA